MSLMSFHSWSWLDTRCKVNELFKFVNVSEFNRSLSWGISAIAEPHAQNLFLQRYAALYINKGLHS